MKLGKNTNEVDEYVVMYEKGENRIKFRMLDFVKMGFGFYVGYNLAKSLRDRLKPKTK